MSRARQLTIRYWGAVPFVVIAALLALRACVATPPLEKLARVASDPRDPPGSVARAGSLYIARGGPVIVGFQAPAGARLTVGDKEITGRGLMRDRIVLPQGPVAIRFAVSGLARLVWSPVGRRGDPEYVPASSLTAEPPERAEFGVFAGAAFCDGLIAIAILLVIIGAVLMLVRTRLARVERRTWLVIGGVFGAALVVRVVGIWAFGQTWDEDVNWSSGRNYITNLLSLDVSAGSWGWNQQHPPVMKYLVGIGAQLADGFGPARVISAIVNALGCALLVPIGARLFNARVGLLAGVMAALLPPFVAHGQIVGHESPTLLWWSLGILLALDASHDDVRTTRLRMAGVGVVIGLAAASRYVAGLLGPVAWVCVIVRGRSSRTALEATLIMPVVALATFYLVWPRLWFHPITALHESMAVLSVSHSPEPFLGTITNQPSSSYFLAYLVATLPIGLAVGALAWFAQCAKDWRASVIIGAWFIVPLAVMESPVRQDGVRYVLPCVMALVMMAAAGWDWVTRTLVRVPFAAVAAPLAIYLAVALALVHPYYLDYFAEQVGGPAHVQSKRWFETAWWGEGIEDAVDYVNSHAAPNARVFRNCIEPAHLAWFREDLWTPMTNNPAEADWIVTYAPHTHRCSIPPQFARVHVVDVRGATLAEVWQRR